MESKKINQLATEMSPATSDLAIIGDPITGVSKKITWLQVSTLIGTAANLQQVTDNGATTTNQITIGGLTISGFSTGVLKSDSGVISSVPFGAANGVATLGGDGKVPSNQLPSYVDDVVEVANYAALPVTGETGKIYITLDNNKVYRWSGSIYVEIAANQAVWGSITGTLANQTDLQNALNAKATDSLVVHLAGTETITGTKTFSNASKNDGGILLKNGASYSLSGYMNLGGMTDGLRFTSGGGISNYFTLPSSIGYTYTFPEISGTIVAISGGNSTQYIDGTGALQTFPTLLSSDNLVKLVRNQSGATMTAGTIVYISGATGNKPLITKAIATSDATSAQTYGIVQANIANNADGYVVIIGNVNDIDTSALTEGQQLYLSGTTAGTWTTTKPYAPIHLVYVGIVLRSHPTQGIIGVKIQNGYEMDELHNVDAQSPSNNDILSYNTTTSLWEHKQIATTLGFTPANDSSVVHLAGTETITGNKTFSGVNSFTSATSFTYATTFMNGTSLNWTAAGSHTGGTLTLSSAHSGSTSSLILSDGDTAKYIYFSFTNTATGIKTYTLPDTTGTLALTSDLSSYLPLSGGVMTGQIVLKEASSSTDYSKGLRFPNDPFTGSGDVSGLRLYCDTSTGGENQVLELYVGNDVNPPTSADKINFSTGVNSTTNNDLVTINNNKIWNAGNLSPVTIDTTQTITGAKTFSSSLIVNGTGTNNAHIQFQTAGTNKWKVGNTYSGGDNFYSVYNYALSTDGFRVKSDNEVQTLGNILCTGIDGSSGANRIQIRGSSTYSYLEFLWTSSFYANWNIKRNISTNDFLIERCNSTGGVVDTSLKIDNSTGLITLLNTKVTSLIVGTSTTAPTNGLNVSGISIFNNTIGINVTPNTWVSTGSALQLGSFASISQQHNGATEILSGAYESSASTYKYTSTGVYPIRTSLNLNDGSYIIYNAPTGTAGNTITWSQKFSIAAAGNATFSSYVTITGGNNLFLTNTKLGGDASYNFDIDYNTGGSPLMTWYAGTTSQKVQFGNSSRINVSAMATGSYGISFSGANGSTGLYINQSNASWNTAYNGGANTADTVMTIGKDATTGRSVNAGGTIYASGNDYAEYMFKATLDNNEKGDIIGINNDGLLTNIFADANSFVIKSTDPSYVGGDTWSNYEQTGEKPIKQEGQDDAEFEIIMNEWKLKLEVERAKVDRIAFSGQVPCNIYGANVGDYIIPIELPNGKISGQAINNPTFEQYQQSIGKVWKIMNDGRAWVAVKIG